MSERRGEGERKRERERERERDLDLELQICVFIFFRYERALVAYVRLNQGLKLTSQEAKTHKRLKCLTKENILFFYSYLNSSQPPGHTLNLKIMLCIDQITNT